MGDLAAAQSFAARARRECPEPSIADRDLLAHATARLERGEELSALRAGELRLCAASALGDPPAVRLLLRRLEAVARTLPGDAASDEALQRARVRLLVEGRIADYRGRGLLDGFLRVVLARLSQDARGDQARVERLAARLEEPPSGDVELELIRERYRPAFERALSEELQALPRKTRVLLRLHHAQGMSVDRLARIYHLGRSTLARHLQDYRRQLLESTRARLQRELRVSGPELDSLVRLLASRVHVTLERALADTPSVEA